MEKQDMWEILPTKEGQTQNPEFGRILRESGWNGDTRTSITIEYLLPNGEVVARGIYDNESCSYIAFIKKGVQKT